MTTNTAPLPHAEEQPRYLLSEARHAALLSLTALAPGLSEAELRTALYLASLEDPNTHSVSASSRQIAAATRLERKNVRRAIDSLTSRCLIATRQGTPTSAGTYLLNFTQTATIRGGVTVTPPPVTTQQPLFLEVGSQQPHPSEPQTPLDIPNDFDRIIDRVLTATKSQFAKDELTRARENVYGFHSWWSRKRGAAEPHPPDDRILAQILVASGDVRVLEGLITTLWKENREPGTSYGWYVSVALQRLHGIRPEATNRRRAQLKIVKKRDASLPDPAQDSGEFQQEIMNELRQVKRL